LRRRLQRSRSARGKSPADEENEEKGEDNEAGAPNEEKGRDASVVLKERGGRRDEGEKREKKA
jgi:hypothetical protein